MNKTILFTLSLLLAASLSVMAGVKRVDDGGQELTIDDYIPSGESGVIVFYASWDSPSTELANEVESWSSTFSGLNVVIVDITDLRTQVCQQFDIDEIPSIIVVDEDHEQVGSIVDNTSDLEELLEDEGMI